MEFLKNTSNFVLCESPTGKDYYFERNVVSCDGQNRHQNGVIGIILKGFPGIKIASFIMQRLSLRSIENFFEPSR